MKPCDRPKYFVNLQFTSDIILVSKHNAHAQVRLRRWPFLRQQKWAAGQTSPAAVGPLDLGSDQANPLIIKRNHQGNSDYLEL
jgi:hypothetical protein